HPPPAPARLLAGCAQARQRRLLPGGLFRVLARRHQDHGGPAMALKDGEQRDTPEASVPSEGRKGAPARRRAPAAGPSQAGAFNGAGFIADGFNIWAFAGTLVGWGFLLLGQRVLAPMEGLAKMCTWAAILLLFAS